MHELMHLGNRSGEIPRLNEKQSGILPHIGIDSDMVRLQSPAWQLLYYAASDTPNLI